MKKIHRERLLKLADHLEKGKLGHKKFDFSQWNGNASRELAPLNTCGTNGCAIGECPIVFPRLWKFGDYYPELRRGHQGFPRKDAMPFFGVSHEESHVLFIPRGDLEDGTRVGPLRQMSARATRYRVAKQIRRFVAWKDKQ